MMDKISAGACQVAEVVTSVIFSAILLVFMWEAAWRLVIGGSPQWFTEIPRSLMLYVTFIACAALIKSDGLIYPPCASSRCLTCYLLWGIAYSGLL